MCYFDQRKISIACEKYNTCDIIISRVLYFQIENLDYIGETRIGLVNLWKYLEVLFEVFVEIRLGHK